MNLHQQISPHQYEKDVLAVYNHAYAMKYESIYLVGCRRKHEMNIAYIRRLFHQMPAGKKRWLDTCCGQAWHFSQFPNPEIEKVGVDISEAQLQLAEKRCPEATFIQHDVLSIDFPEESFDLVTNFWGAYCYLNSYERIGRLLTNAAQWTKPGGALYFEVILPDDIEGFNATEFARSSGFHVGKRNKDYSKWFYRDMGGVHLMTSPPLEFFLDMLSPYFQAIRTEHDSVFMTHLIAYGKKTKKI